MVEWVFLALSQCPCIFLGWSFQEEREEKEKVSKRPNLGGCVFISLSHKVQQNSLESCIFEQSLGSWLFDLIHFSLFLFFICSAFCTGPGLLGKIFGGPKSVNFQLWRVEILISRGEGERLWFKRAPVDFLSGFPTHLLSLLWVDFHFQNLEKIRVVYPAKGFLSIWPVWPKMLAQL